MKCLECHCEGYLCQTSEGAVLKPETRKSTLPELKKGKSVTAFKIKHEIPFFGENLRAFKEGFFETEEVGTGVTHSSPCGIPTAISKMA